MASQDASKLHGPEHVRVYRETDGEVGHRWRRGTSILLLTTTGRHSGMEHTTPLIYGRHGDDYVVVASKGGAETHPDWYLNLQADPHVEVQVMDDVFPALAETVEGSERTRLWALMREIWPAYDEYQTKTDRQIPVVVLTPQV